MQYAYKESSPSKLFDTYLKDTGYVINLDESQYKILYTSIFSIIGISLIVLIFSLVTISSLMQMSLSLKEHMLPIWLHSAAIFSCVMCTIMMSAMVFFLSMAYMELPNSFDSNTAYAVIVAHCMCYSALCVLGVIGGIHSTHYWSTFTFVTIFLYHEAFTFIVFLYHPLPVLVNVTYRGTVLIISGMAILTTVKIMNFKNDHIRWTVLYAVWVFIGTTAYCVTLRCIYAIMEPENLFKFYLVEVILSVILLYSYYYSNSLIHKTLFPKEQNVKNGNNKVANILEATTEEVAMALQHQPQHSACVTTRRSERLVMISITVMYNRDVADSV